MKSILLTILMIGLIPLLSWAQQDKDEVPPGMEAVYVGKTRFVVPKGLKVRRQEGLLVMEKMDEFVGRRFLEMEEQLAQAAAREEKLEQEIAQLSKDLDAVRQDEIKRLKARLDQAEAEENKLKQEIEQSKKVFAEIEEIAQYIEAVEANQKKLQKDVLKLKDVFGQIEAIEERLTKVESRLEETYRMLNALIKR